MEVRVNENFPCARRTPLPSASVLQLAHCQHMPPHKNESLLYTYVMFLPSVVTCPLLRGGFPATCNTRNVGRGPPSPSGMACKRASRSRPLAATSYSSNMSVAPRYFGDCSSLGTLEETANNGYVVQTCGLVPYLLGWYAFRPCAPHSQRPDLQ